MEEDVVETKTVEPYAETNSGAKDGKTESDEHDSGSYTSSQQHNLSRILSINPLADSKDSSSIAANCIQKTEELEDGAASLCVCGEPSTERISEDDTQQLQV